MMSAFVRCDGQVMHNARSFRRPVEGRYSGLCGKVAEEYVRSECHFTIPLQEDSIAHEDGLRESTQ